MTRGHKCTYKKQINEELLDDAVAEIIAKLVSNPKFASMMQKKINMEVDASTLEQEIAALEKQLRQCYSIKTSLDIFSIDWNCSYFVIVINSNETVFDAYCGIGVMSLMLARKCKHLIGVEIVPEAIETAKESAALNGITNAEFLVGACEDVLPDLIKNGQKPDVLVVDPPRAGCEASLLDAIADASIQKIVYVSCNPATLARDMKILAGRGYTCSPLTFVDMFAQTKHLETVVLMSKYNNSEKEIRYEFN